MRGIRAIVLLMSINAIARTVRAFVARGVNPIQYQVRRVAVSLLAALLVALPFIAPASAPATAYALPAGLPSHFSFGLGAGADNNGIYGYMPQMGIPWDYAMQYLVGGVNTAQGWETWNTSGTFASNYATQASKDGFIPVFPYYELLQSKGTCNGCAENQTDITNLNNTGVMNAYYANFALLMQRLGTGNYGGVQGFGKTAIVLVEPDFVGGYAFQATNNGTCFSLCTGTGNNPSLLKASVANSGYAGVAAYPNTYAGFIQALAHLRDQYAPNVLLGLDVSMWATGDDIGLDTSSTTNRAALGQNVGTFLSKTGPHDLLVNDPLDRDAGQYQVQFGQNRWWDRLNVTYPNFKGWEQYLQGAHQADGGKSVLLWQVPDGNQYFDTVNNTNGHFQDNRAEYIFGHISELIQSGIVGAIFMPGNSGATNFDDAIADGVTNPASLCTSSGVSSGQVCNNHTSTVADDDGGYLRMQGHAYYGKPVALSGGSTSTNTPTPVTTSTPAATATGTQSTTASYTTSASASPSSVAQGTSTSLTASVTSSAAATALVDLEVYDTAGTKVFQQAWDNQSFTAGQTRTFSAPWQVSTTAATGTYTLALGVFSPAWGTLYSWNASAGALTVKTSVPATSTPTPLPTSTPTATATSAGTQPSYTTGASVSPSSVKRGSPASITASVKSGTATSVLVDVEVYDSAGQKVFQQAWDNQSFTAGQTRTFTAAYTPAASAATGTYTVMIGVFSPGWGTLYSWNSSAAALTIS
jgi:hypothetical protein